MKHFPHHQTKQRFSDGDMRITREVEPPGGSTCTGESNPHDSLREHQ